MGLNPALRAAWAFPPVNRLATGALRLVGFRGAFRGHELPRAGPIQAMLPDGRVMRVWANGDDTVSTGIYWNGWRGHEPETLPIFYGLAKQSSVIFDVGAHIGHYSLVAGLANPDARVHAFEPLERVFLRLRNNVQRTGLENVATVRAAVSDRLGAATFYHVPEPLPSSSSLSREFMQSESRLAEEEVEVVTLDGYAEGRGIERVDLMKIDTESTEPAVLRGALGILVRDRPRIICEVLPGYGVEEELEAILSPLGYRYFRLTEQGPQEVQRIVGGRPARNYLFEM